MARPAQANILLSAICDNYRLAKHLSGAGKAMAVIKANAYGHGAVTVAKSLSTNVGADAFAVACIEEALALRESGIQTPIYLLEGVFTPDELPIAARESLGIAIHTQQQLDWLLQAKPVKAIDVLLKIDTGMHRLGFEPHEVASAYALLRNCPQVNMLTLMSHFSRADECHDPTTQQQIETFATASTDLAVPVSLANSAALLAWPAARRDWNRPGIMLYGASPLDMDNASSAQLQPVMRLCSEVIAIHDLAAGESIGYGARYTCQKPTRVGVVAMGYGDGYPRQAADGTPVVVDGKQTQLIGRVSMDMLTVDLSDLPDSHIGSSVELWGEQVPVNQVAACADTIAYTLFTGITQRVPKRYQA